jgi:hypothetical protein
VSENVIITSCPVAFWNLEQLNYRTSRSPSAISREFGIVICNIEYNEFDSNWRINNLSNIIMTHRDLDATYQILWDFISGHLMHLHLVYIYCYNQNMITVVAVRPNVILCRQYLFSPQIAPSIIIVWQNITYCSKKWPFSIKFQFAFAEIFIKGKNRSNNLL